MCHGARYPEICLVRRGSAQARRALDEHGYDRFYHVEAKVPADARRITLAGQDEKWLSRKVDILAVDKVWEAAERQYEEVSKQSRATLRAYCAKPPGGLGGRPAAGERSVRPSHQCARRGLGPV
jgi:hypothetical protein